MIGYLIAIAIGGVWVAFQLIYIAILIFERDEKKKRS